MTRLRLLWPIVDPLAAFPALLEEASREIPALARRHHARITGPGRFTVARSLEVPGSGRTTEWVLLWEAPAVHRPATLGIVADDLRQELAS